MGQLLHVDEAPSRRRRGACRLTEARAHVRSDHLARVGPSPAVVENRCLVLEHHALSQRALALQAWCKTNGTKPRFGAIGMHGSIAIIERFIRSLKHEHLHRLLAPFAKARVEAPLASYAAWYNEHRPHEALDGRTPNEVLHGRSARCAPRFETRARFPLRDGFRRCADLEMTVRFIDGHRHLPVVELREAA